MEGRVDEHRVRLDCYITKDVTLHFDSEQTSVVVRTDEDVVYLYEAMFQASLTLLFLRVFRELLSYLNMAPHQIVPNAPRVFFACVAIWPKVIGDEHSLTIREFLWIYKPTKNPDSDALFTFVACQRVKFIKLEKA